MIEIEVGSIINCHLGTKSTLKIIEAEPSCERCHFNEKKYFFNDSPCTIAACRACDRKDGKNIIYQEIKE